MSVMKNTKYTPLTLILLLSLSCVPEDPCSTKNVDGTERTLTSEEIAKCDQNTGGEPDDEPGRVPSQNPGDPDIVELSNSISTVVDDIYNRTELGKTRDVRPNFPVDTCHEKLDGLNQFSDSIAFAIGELSKGQKVQLQGLGSIFGYGTNPAAYKDVSLISHKLCDVTQASLAHTMGSRPKPDTETRSLSQRFADDHNKYRDQFLDGDSQGIKNFQKHWGKFFGCLAYTESLTTADTSTSRSVASQYAASNYTKPAGVKFYIDPRQTQASKLNIGMFQFTPTYGGNINPCVKQWNKEYPSCSIDGRSTNDMINAVGSTGQRFNAYCGVHKLLQTFFVQSHSSQTKRTHPSNFSGGMKAPELRCVTPHIHASLGYNHFGPLQNTTGTNLKKLMKCVYN